jgi:hypothetical protein
LGWIFSLFSSFASSVVRNPVVVVVVVVVE